MSPTAFQKAYHSLNPAQKKAVDTLEGPVMVIAGPGTGKTQILATRIANILLKTDADPGSILALTFTDSGSANMRERLLSLIGPTAYRLNINTFHSFTSKIIQEFPDYFIFSQNAQPLTDLERFDILHRIIDQNDFELIKPINAPYYYIYTGSAIPSALQTLKREGVTPDKLKSILDLELTELQSQRDELNKTEFEKRNKDLLKNLDLLKFYLAYQEELKQQSRYDFDDMINWVVQELKKENSELLSILQERFHYFLVDEYQDTNSAQNEIVDLLASYWGSKANIFVVGDDQQSIFRFQGASLENALNFTKTYSDAKIITLTENYRSNQNILDAAQSVIKNNQENLENTFKINRQLNANASFPSTKIKVADFTAEILEHFYVAEEVNKLLQNKVPPKNIAIIAHTNAELKSLSTLLEHKGIPFQIQNGINVLETPPIIYLLKLFRLIHQSRLAVDDLTLFTLLHYPFLNFDHLDILKVTRAASLSKKPLFEFINSDSFKNQKLTSPNNFTQFIEKITLFNQVDSTLPFINFAEFVLKESGLLNWVLEHPDSLDYLKHLNTFFDFIRSLNSTTKELNLTTFLKNIDLVESNRLNLLSPDLELQDHKITLTTAHKSKGLEWQHIFIIGCVDGNWGNKSSRNLLNLPIHILRSDLHNDPQEDERRLFYVALTRAKQSITITYSKTSLSYNRLKETLPSLFLSELDSQHLQLVSPSVNQTEVKNLLETLLTPPVSSYDSTEKDLIADLLKNFRLSVTALNTYLECPYKFKLNHLLRVPRAKETHLSFGTAVHSALEKFYKHYQLEHQFPTKDQLITTFETALSQELLTPLEYKDRLRQGKTILSAYYDHCLVDCPPALFTEKFFGYGFNPVFLDDIPLAGKIDRIDWVDQADRTVKVIDYKTGSRKTRGQIEGTTQDSDGSYKRQLVFYKLLADLDQKFAGKVVAAELDFVETPHREGKVGKETFNLTKENVEELKTLIRHCMKEIRDHNFQRTKDFSICSNCDLASHCWPSGIPLINPEQLKIIG